MDEAADAGKKDSGGKGIVVNKAGVFGTGRGLGIAGAGSDAATKRPFITLPSRSHLA